MPGFEGVIFDMDGTLILSPLDFGKIRAELDIPTDRGTLEEIEAMPPHRRRTCEQRLLEMELEAASQARIAPGAAEALAAVRTAGLKTGLLTRNARPVMEMILDRFPVLRFDLTWSRENGPIKPEPDGILRACAALGIAPQRTACVGDYHYDIVAANAAGTTSILLAPDAPPDFAKDADFVITALGELPAVLGI